MLDLSTKLYLRALSLFASPNPNVIFIILIIILNLFDPNVSEFGCNIKLGSLGYESGWRSYYKSVIIKKKKINITEWN